MNGMRRVAAWLLLLGALFFALAFATYDPASPQLAVSNLGGPIGRIIASPFVEGFGIGSFVLCFFMALLGYLMFVQKPARDPVLRVVGLIICMLTVGAFWQTVLPTHAFPGGSAPLGGFLGELVSFRMRSLLGTVLTMVVLAVGTLAGLYLLTDDLMPSLWRRLRGLEGHAELSLFKRMMNGLGLGSSPSPAVATGRDDDLAAGLILEDEIEEEALPKAKRARAKPNKAKGTKSKNKKSKAVEKAAAEVEAPYVDEEDENWEEAEGEDDWVYEDELPEGEEGEYEIEGEEEDEEGDWEYEDEAEVEAEDDGEYEDEVEEEEAEAEIAVPKPPVIRQAVQPASAEGIHVIRLSRDKNLDVSDKYPLPPLSLLTEPTYLQERESDSIIQKKAAALEEALSDFNVKATVAEVERGPVVTRFDLVLERGTKISKVTGLSDDLALALGVRRVRIAPVKGKSALGVEIPNKKRQTVYLKELAVAEDLTKRKIAIPLFLGKDASGHPIVEDLATTPHLLIAGRTGAGKSVFVNNLILSILLTRYPEECRLIMIDPKKVELEVYQDIPHLLTKVESNPKKATKILEWAVNQMEERYELLAATGVRHLTSYNKLGKKTRKEKLLRMYSEGEVEKLPTYLPYVVIIVDELADLMMAAGKEVEQAIARLAQKARAVGIHVVLATQRPSTDVITGLIKSNLPARIAFQTRTGIDSRTILDRYGAEKLLDKGDMLYLSSTSDDPRRVQGPFVSDQEVESTVDYLKEHAAPLYTHHLEQVSSSGNDVLNVLDQDELFEQAVEVVFTTGQASASFLQRRMKVGYARASRLIDLMGDAGIVSEHRGSKAREILMSPEQWEEIRTGSSQASE